MVSGTTAPRIGLHKFNGIMAQWTLRKSFKSHPKYICKAISFYFNDKLNAFNNIKDDLANSDVVVY